MDDSLLRDLIGKSREEILWETTRDYLASLAPEVEDAAYRCAILHWFNRDILQAVLGVGQLTHLEQSSGLATTGDAGALYKQLQALPFVEEYPGRGYNFHDLTREVVLKHLWVDEPKFFRQVSIQAVIFFAEIDAAAEETDWEVVVELAYHLLIADEAQGVETIHQTLADLSAQGYLGKYHSLVQAVEEHEKAGRLSAENLPLVQLWRIQESYSTNNFDRLEQRAKDFIAESDDVAPLWMKAEATWYLADGLRLDGSYEQAYKYFEENVRQYQQLESPEEVANALLGLGRVTYAQDKYDQAGDFFAQALLLCVQTLIIPPAETTDLEAEIELRIFYPEAWHRQELYPVQEELEETPAPGPDGEEPVEPLPELLIVYNIEIETAPENILDQAIKTDDESTPLWPVNFDNLLAEIWLSYGYLHQAMDDYDVAAACGRLSGQMFIDLDNAYGLQRALQLLHGLGAMAGDLELVQASLVSQSSLLEVARERGDRRTILDALLTLAASSLLASEYESSRNNYAEALDLAHTMQDTVGEATALDGLARVDWINGDYQRAEKRFSQALALYRQVNHREGQARLYLSLGDFKSARYRIAEAIDDYWLAFELYQELKVPTGQFDALVKLGGAEQDHGNYEQALKFFEQAVDLARKMQRPSLEARGLSSSARLHDIRGDQKKAREVYEKASKLARKVKQREIEAEILLGLGDLAANQKRFEEATDFYQQARQLYTTLTNPYGEINVLSGMIGLYQRQKDAGTAIKMSQDMLALARAQRDRAQEIRALLTLVDSLRLNQDYEGMLATLDEALTLEPNNPITLIAKGDFLAEIAEYEAAVEILERATQLAPANSDGFASKGWALENLGRERAQEAREAYETALRLLPHDLWLHSGLANALRLMGHREAANVEYRWIIEQAQQRRRVEEEQSTLGWCYYQLGEYDQALQCYSGALTQDPDQLSSQFGLGLALMAKGEYSQALQTYKQGLALTKRKHPLGQRGLLYVARDDLREAITRHPELAEVKEALETIQLLNQAWNDTPSFPRL